MSDFIKYIMDYITELLSPACRIGIKDFIDDIIETISDVIEDVADFFVDTFNEVVGFFAPEPQEPNLTSFAAESQGRVRQFKQPITAHRFVYGEFRLSGPLTFIDVSLDNNKIHLIITLAAHPVQAIEDIYFGDEVIPSDAIDGTTGVVSSGRFANTARIFKSLGDEGAAQPFPALVSATTAWTTNHLQQGRAKIYVSLAFDKDVYPRGVPAISAWVKGKKVVDPRNSSTEAWTVNPVLIIRDYMTTSTVDGGGGATTLEFDDTFTNSAANTSEEIVSTQRIDTVITAVDTATDIATLIGSTIEIFTGDRVRVSATTSTIGGLSAGVDYYVIATQRLDTARIQFASTYALALAGTAKSLTTSGEGQQSVFKTGEPRYTMNGFLQVDRTPAAMIGDALTSMAGQMIYASGTWRMKAGVYTAPTITLDENDFISGITLQTRIGRRSRFNAVKGIYVTSLNLDQPADYPSVTNATYETEDNGERTFRELDLKNTNRPQTASRLAKISLERHRQMISFRATTTLKGLQLQAGDTVSIDNARFGWSAKVFEVGEWRLIQVANEGNPTLGCEMSFRETATTVFDWNSGEETVVDPAANSSLPDMFTVLPPEGLEVNEELYSTRNIGVKARGIISWMAPNDLSIVEYEVQQQQTQDKDGNAVTESFSVIARTTEVFLIVYDIEPGVYNIRVKSLSLLGVSSDFTTKPNQEIFGLLAPPTEPQNLTISAVSGSAILRWDATPDLDVKVGGTYIFRHDNALTGASWGTSVGIGTAIAGSETTVSLPLKSGTYLAKAKDSSNVESTDAASVSTKQATAANFTLASTITESTNFPGSTTNVVVGDGMIKLTASGLIDSVADFSTIADIDGLGGLHDSGIYLFNTAFDWTTVLSKRYTTTVVAAILNANDLMDSKTDLIDTWTTFDGDETSGADARVYVRETDDDPSGSPTWSSWNLLDSADLTARAVQFRMILTTTDSAFNIQVSELSVAADTAG